MIGCLKFPHDQLNTLLLTTQGWTNKLFMACVNGDNTCRGFICCFFLVLLTLPLEPRRLLVIQHVLVLLERRSYILDRDSNVYGGLMQYNILYKDKNLHNKLPLCVFVVRCNCQVSICNFLPLNHNIPTTVAQSHTIIICCLSTSK